MHATRPFGPLQIGTVTLSTPLALAPMAGVTHAAFRRLIRPLGGCGLACTEMIAAAAFTPRALNSHHLLDLYPDEHPIAVQIAGHDPDLIARAAMVAQEKGTDLVEINAGCPAPSVTRKGGGAALLRDLPRLEAILRAVRRTVSIPLMLKFRSGWSPNEIVALEVARMAEACGCQAITLHPRTRQQRYTGRADWDLIRQVAQDVRIPVLGSGDIRSPEDARRAWEESGCAGLMLAQGVLRNLWLIAQIAAAFAGTPPPQPTPADLQALLLRYLALLQGTWPEEHKVLARLKRLAGKVQTGRPNRREFRRAVGAARSVEEARTVILSLTRRKTRSAPVCPGRQESRPYGSGRHQGGMP